jgi:hypothetical protein
MNESKLDDSLLQLLQEEEVVVNEKNDEMTSIVELNEFINQENDEKKDTLADLNELNVNKENNNNFTRLSYEETK